MRDMNWFEPYMTPGERALWTGEPAKRSLSLRAMEAVFLLLTLLAVGWGSFVLYPVLTAEGWPPTVYIVFAVIVGYWILMAVYQFTWPWLRRMKGLHSASYAITDRRILRCRAGLVDGLLLAHLPTPHLALEKDGSGSIRFWPVAAGNRESSSCKANLGNMAGFELSHIPDASQVYDLLCGLKAAHPAVAPIADKPLIPLEAGEKLLWQGSPDSRRCRPEIKADGWLFPSWMIIAAGGFEVMVMLTVGWAEGIWMVYGFLSALVLAGVLMLLIPLQRSRKEMTGAVYAVTDRRILRQQGKRLSGLRLDRGELPPGYMAQGRDGTATLMLCSLPVSHGGTRITFSDAAGTMEGFQLRQLQEAARVAEIIGAAAAQYREQTS